MVTCFFQAEDGIRDTSVTGVQTCALPISRKAGAPESGRAHPDVDDHVEDRAAQHAHQLSLRPLELVVQPAQGPAFRERLRSEERRVGKECRARWGAKQKRRNREHWQTWRS